MLFPVRVKGVLIRDIVMASSVEAVEDFHHERKTESVSQTEFCAIEQISVTV